MRSLPRLAAGLLSLFLTAGAAKAWGPFTHCVINQLSLETLGEHPEVPLLHRKKHQKLYVQAGSTADLVFQIHRGGKTDPALNRVLHEASFHHHLYRYAVEQGDERGQVFAMGLAGHLAGDEVGNSQDSPTSYDLFSWSRQEDVFGRPVDDPEGSAAGQLRGVSIGMGKIAIDGLMREEKKLGRFYHPVVVGDALIPALQSYQGVHSLPNATEEEREALEDKVKGFSRSFFVSFKALQKFDLRVWMNGRVRRPLKQFYGGSGRQLPRIRESAAAATQAVLALVRGELPETREALARASGATVPGAGTPHSEEDPARGCLSGLPVASLDSLQRALSESDPALEEEAAEEDSPGGDPEGGPGADEAPVELLAPEGPARLPARSRGPEVPEEKEALAGLRRRAMTRFFGGLLVPARRWEKIRSRVRGLVPLEVPEPVPAGAPAAAVGEVPDMGGLVTR